MEEALYKHVLLNGMSFTEFNGEKLMSPYNGTPIKAVLAQSKQNPKTGEGWAVTLFLQDQNPNEAIRAGTDSAICGECPLRLHSSGTRRYCYVSSHNMNQMQAKQNRLLNPSVNTVVSITGNSYLRLGSYGDVAMLPFSMMAPLTRDYNPEGCRKWTGYTHQWAQPWYDKAYDTILMRSVETAEQARQCQKEGARTFRTDWEGVGGLENEVECPNYNNPSITCNKCGLCNGVGPDGQRSKVKNVWIKPHGTVTKTKNYSKNLLMNLNVLQ